MNRRPLLIAVIVVVVAVLTWLGLQDQNDAGLTEPANSAPGTNAPAPGRAGTATPTTPDPASATDSETAQTEQHHDHDHDHEAGEDAVETLDEPVEASWSPATRSSAEQAATAAMAAYTDHQATQKKWWKRLEPLLTPGAQFVYADVPHEQIPATKVTGKVTVERTDSTLLATATVPTDADTYELVLTRVNGAADWLVDKIVPTGQ